MAPPLKELEQRTFGSWRLLTLVDSGGMGAIFQGQHTELGTRVAIKVLLMGTDAPAEVVVRFLNEAKIGANLVHQNIARTIDLFRDSDGRSFIVMEWLDGESLARRLRRGPCSLREAESISLGICKGLGAAHRSNIVHRDIKPGNVFLAREHGELVPKIIDFGIARLTASSNHTRTGLVMGSPPYMAPEQWKGAKHVTVQSDVFALGVVIYEMMTGTNPFAGDTLPEISVKITTQSLPPHPNIPPPIFDVLLAATARDSTTRISSADDLGALLAAGFARAEGNADGLVDPLLVEPSTEVSNDCPPVAPVPQTVGGQTVPESTGGVARTPEGLPPLSPHYAPPVLMDEHAVAENGSASASALWSFLKPAAPAAILMAVLSILLRFGTIYPEATASFGMATTIIFALMATALFGGASIWVIRQKGSRARAMLAALLLTACCWGSLIIVGETWAALDARGMSWKREAARKQVFQLGMGNGSLWLAGLALGALVTWVRTVTPEENEQEDAPPL
ncbi:MAG: serine/threonine protein kinase [Polyangiaceae bacterium]|nr:serine/threonine protein kinase [Polyangiaceae bacterium]